MAVGQSVFSNRLVTNLETKLGGSSSSFNPTELFQTGATDIYSKLPPTLRGPVLEAFNDAITQVYIVSICTSSLTIVGSLAMEWRSVKKVHKVEGTEKEVLA